jgi:hypothetical protein
MSTLKAALWGALAGIVVVGILVGGAVYKAAQQESASGDSANGPVAVALVLPDAEGAVTLRVLDVYTLVGGRRSVRSVSPTTPALVSGTGGNSLADAYSYGGGKMLADTLGEQAGLPVSGWVIVDQAGWNALNRNSPFQVDLASGIEVFDGSRLYSFGQGHVSVPAAQVARLMDGAAYLKPSESRDVRVQIGDVLRSALTSAGADLPSQTRSSLSDSALRDWARGARSAGRVPGT